MLTVTTEYNFSSIIPFEEQLSLFDIAYRLKMKPVDMLRIIQITGEYVLYGYVPLLGETKMTITC